MALSMINPHRFSEKHSDVKQTLQLDILANRSQDPTSGEKINRLRAICYMHEALLREEKRFKNMSKQEDSQSKKKE